MYLKADPTDLPFRRTYEVEFDSWTFVILGSSTSRVSRSLPSPQLLTAKCIEGAGSIVCLQSIYFETKVWKLVS